MKGRFAPSPTGYIHLGNVWIALLSYISTRQQQGEYVVRMEDIDLQRSKRELGETLLDDLEWLGFDWDEGPRVGGPLSSYWQSERQGYYAAVLDRLALDRRVYPCFCNRTRLQSIASAPHLDETVHRYDGHCRHLSSEKIDLLRVDKKPSLRLAVDTCEMHVMDRWQGSQNIRLVGELDDYVLRRGDGMYAYNLAVILDDIAMGISEVIRGDDLLDTTGQQLYLYKTLKESYQFDFKELVQHFGIRSDNLKTSDMAYDTSPIVIPSYGHAPLLIDKDGYRLSKRQKSITVRELRQQEWSPERILGELVVQCGLLSETSLPSRKISLKQLLNIDLDISALCRKTVVVDCVG